MSRFQEHCRSCNRLSDCVWRCEHCGRDLADQDGQTAGEMDV